MALVECKECKEQISDTAKACPKCGAKVPRTKWWLWRPIGAVVAFLAVGVIFGPHSPQEAYDHEYRKCEQTNADGHWNPRLPVSLHMVCNAAAEIARASYR